MRQLTLNEIEYVSGGEFFDTVGAMVIGGVAGASSGIIKAATVGGNTGGILGVGVLGGIGGVVVGGVTGYIQGTLYGMINGWGKTQEWFNNTVEQWFDLLGPLPK